MLIYGLHRSCRQKQFGKNNHNLKMKYLMQCVVPENTHTPPTEGIGISGEGGGGFTQGNFFFPDRLNIIFIQLYVKFRCLHFAS